MKYQSLYLVEHLRGSTNSEDARDEGKNSMNTNGSLMIGWIDTHIYG